MQWQRDRLDNFFSVETLFFRGHNLVTTLIQTNFKENRLDHSVTPCLQGAEGLEGEGTGARGMGEGLAAVSLRAAGSNASRHVTSRHGMLRQVTSSYVCHVTSFLTTSCHAMSQGLAEVCSAHKMSLHCWLNTAFTQLHISYKSGKNVVQT